MSMTGNYVVLNKDGQEIAVILPPQAEHKAALWMFGTTSSDVVSLGKFEYNPMLALGGFAFRCYSCDVEMGARIGVRSRGDRDACLLRDTFETK